MKEEDEFLPPSSLYLEMRLSNFKFFFFLQNNREAPLGLLGFH